MEPEFGDRRQEIVFIGMEMDQGALEAAMDAALLTPEEMRGGPLALRAFADPFSEMFRDRHVGTEV